MVKVQVKKSTSNQANSPKTQCARPVYSFLSPMFSFYTTHVDYLGKDRWGCPLLSKRRSRCLVYTDKYSNMSASKNEQEMKYTPFQLVECLRERFIEHAQDIVIIFLMVNRFFRWLSATAGRHRLKESMQRVLFWKEGGRLKKQEMLSVHISTLNMCAIPH